MHPIRIFSARKIITMNPNRPTVTHVAVRDGKILGAGNYDELKAWGDHSVDERFSNKVLMPGLIEGHSHLMAGSLWNYTYCGYFPVRDFRGKLCSGARDLASVIVLLQNAEREITQVLAPVTGWGFDPIYFGARRCTREDLDQVSTKRPVGMMHASGHILNVNTEALKQAGYWRLGIEHPGIVLGSDGYPTGELRGPEAMGPAFSIIGLSRSFLSGDAFGIAAFGQLCVQAGVTTATDLAATLGEEELGQLFQATEHADYPVTIVPFLRLIGMSPSQAVARALALATRSTERVSLGRIKMVADGSIQGFTARLRWPGYFNGAPNGLWYTPPEVIRDCFERAIKAGVQVHIHTNGDEATEAALDCMEQALRTQPAFDHRFFLQHCQLADAAQFRRMKALGMGANLFANHHHYWGDQHYQITVGPERAERMNATATAAESGVPFAIHSDAPITPLAPLFTAWCAVHRLTASGRVLGESECISVQQALHAITLGAAYSLKMDDEIGSIETGKRADFCVLEDDPLALEPMRLKDIKVWGTVQAGRVFQAPASV